MSAPAVSILVTCPSAVEESWGAAVLDAFDTVLVSEHRFKLGWDAFSWAMKAYVDMKAAS